MDCICFSFKKRTPMTSLNKASFKNEFLRASRENCVTTLKRHISQKKTEIKCVYLHKYYGIPTMFSFYSTTMFKFFLNVFFSQIPHLTTLNCWILLKWSHIFIANWTMRGQTWNISNYWICLKKISWNVLEIVIYPVETEFHCNSLLNYSSADIERV